LFGTSRGVAVGNAWGLGSAESEGHFMKTHFLSTHIEHWPIERLIPYARNARTHAPAQIAQLEASIREFGFTNPILVDVASGVLAGHARLQAARRLRLADVPVIVLDHLSEDQKRAYILADNKLAQNAGWDQETLRSELEALAAVRFDLSLTGFSSEELDELAAAVLVDAGADPDETVPPEPQAVSREGDLWILGPHRLICADALDRTSYERLLEPPGAEMIFTDPPYNVDYQSQSRRLVNDNLGEAFAAFLGAACARMLEFCEGAVYVCMSSSELSTLQAAFQRAGGHWSTFVIWAKSSFTLGRSDYQRQYEPILYGWREGAQRHWCGDRHQGDVWNIYKPTSNDLHPTMKPVELVRRAVENSSRRNDRVLDPFAGSGTTLIACEATGRRARLMELDPRYADVIIRRWRRFTGREAVLDGDGRGFQQIASERTPEEAQQTV
jgi:DNA modification methylase